MNSYHMFKVEITPILHNTNFICKSVIPGERISSVMKQVSQALSGAGLFLRTPEVLPPWRLPPVGSEEGESGDGASVWKPGLGSEMWGTSRSGRVDCGEDPSPGQSPPCSHPCYKNLALLELVRRVSWQRVQEGDLVSVRGYAWRGSGRQPLTKRGLRKGADDE